MSVLQKSSAEKYGWLVLSMLMAACSSESSQRASFTFVKPAHSNLNFSNTIRENEILNILDHEYLYNGGGVGIADFNGDGLLDICFTGNMVPSSIYINKGNLTFEDVTETSGFNTNQWCTGVSIVDINTDGKPDIHISTAHDLSLQHSPNYFFINQTKENGPVEFKEMAQEMNLADTSYSVQAVWLDYDLDGDLDMFLANNSKEEYPKNTPYGQKKDGSGRSTDRLYRNNGPGANGFPIFEDVSQQAGITIEGWSLGVAVTDINEDGHPDVYVANDFLSNDILYVNNGDGTFTNKISTYLKHQSHNSMGIDVADINNDGLQDILVLDMLPYDNLRKKTMFSDIPFDRFNASLNVGYQPQYVRNVLQVNTGETGFSEIGYYAGIAQTDWSWSPLLADFDNDGLRDLYITNGYHKDITDMDFVDFSNSMNTFGSSEDKETKLKEQLNHMKGVHKSNFFFRNLGGDRFADDTKEMGLFKPSYSNGAAYADLDLDGDLDIVVNNINEAALLIENEGNDQQERTTNFFRVAMPLDGAHLGAKIWAYTASGLQFAEFYPHKGYLSSFEPMVHFGLGENAQIDSLRIRWPDQTVSLYKNMKANQTFVPQKTAREIKTIKAKVSDDVALLTQMSLTGMPYFHQESMFRDHQKWPLQFRGYSKPGPILVGGDVNSDGLDDFFIGGTANRASALYLQLPSGDFKKATIHTFAEDMAPENSGACLFDADNDGHLDLYVANGSSEHYAKTQLYQDQLYLNDGLGNFAKNLGALPTIAYPTNTVVPLDIDNDGDLDLFVGGRLDPNHFPFSPRSYILENNKGSFTDVTEKWAPELLFPGMVTGAIPNDINNDGWMDLILVGEWSPIQVFHNKEGRLVLDTTHNGLQNTNGWWNCIKGADFDGDGDTDFVVGNWGLNNPFTASLQKPLTLYAKDFDDNGTVEPIMTYYNQQKEYIVPPRGTLAKQLPMVRKMTRNYEAYGTKTFGELFDKKAIDKDAIFKTYELSSIYIENLGNGNFKYKPLPNEAQWAPILAFLITDLNGDNRPDILGVGNHSLTEVLTGYYDASNGLAFLNDAQGDFKVLKPSQSGFNVQGEARTMLELKNGNKKSSIYIIGLQNDSLKTFKKNPSTTIGTPIR